MFKYSSRIATTILIIFIGMCLTLGALFIIETDIFGFSSRDSLQSSYTWKKIVVYNPDHDETVMTIEGQCVTEKHWSTRTIDVMCLKDESGHFKVRDRIHLHDGLTIFIHEIHYPKRVDGEGLRKIVTYPD